MNYLKQMHEEIGSTSGRDVSKIIDLFYLYSLPVTEETAHAMFSRFDETGIIFSPDGEFVTYKGEGGVPCVCHSPRNIEALASIVHSIGARVLWNKSFFKNALNVSI